MEVKELSLEERIHEIYKAITDALVSAGILTYDINGYQTTWIRELFDSYVVVGGGDKFTAYPYIIDANGIVTLGEPVKVEETWIPVVGKSLKIGARNSQQDANRIQAIHDMAVENGALCNKKKAVDPENLVYLGGEVKSLGNGKVGGYLVRFSDANTPDLSGEFFTKNTDFGKAEKTDIYYQHGMDVKMGTRVIGEGTLKFDEIGAWVEAQLSMRDEYEQYIYELAESGKLGWSSGTAGHLVERESVGKATFIKRWPLGLDASLTPTPCEPRNQAVLVKSLTPVETDADDSEGAGASSDNAEVKTVQPNQLISQKDIKMDENLKTEISAIVAEAVKAAIPAPVADPEPQGALLTAPAVKKVTTVGFADDEMKSFLHYIKTGDDAAYKAAMQGQTDSEGGYAVPDDFYNQIVAKKSELSIIRRMGVVSIPTSLDVLHIPAEDTAATKFVVTAEEGAYDENEPTLAQVAITVHKMTKLIKLSEELEADAKANFAGYLSSVWARAQAAAENYYLVATGTGNGMPQSLLAGATSSAITTAGATAVTAAEMLQLLYKVPDQYSDNMAIVMARATLGSIRALTGNPFSFIPTPAGEGNALNPGSIHGVPVYVTSAMPAMTANLKAVMVVNPDFYAIAEREAMTVQRNPWLYQANGQIGLFAKFRLGGAVTQAEAHYYMTQHA